jgi:hypothetical protein
MNIEGKAHAEFGSNVSAFSNYVFKVSLFINSIKIHCVWELKFVLIL